MELHRIWMVCRSGCSDGIMTYETNRHADVGIRLVFSHEAMIVNSDEGCESIQVNNMGERAVLQFLFREANVLSFPEL